MTHMDDEFAELETTEAEFDAYWASGAPVGLGAGAGGFTYSFAVGHSMMVPAAAGERVDLRPTTSSGAPVLAR